MTVKLDVARRNFQFVKICGPFVYPFFPFGILASIKRANVRHHARLTPVPAASSLSVSSCAGVPGQLTEQASTLPGVAEHDLDHPYVGAAFEKMDGQAMPQRMQGRARKLAQADPLHDAASAEEGLGPRQVTMTIQNQTRCFK